MKTTLNPVFLTFFTVVVQQKESKLCLDYGMEIVSFLMKRALLARNTCIMRFHLYLFLHVCFPLSDNQSFSIIAAFIRIWILLLLIVVLLFCSLCTLSNFPGCLSLFTAWFVDNVNTQNQEVIWCKNFKVENNLITILRHRMQQPCLDCHTGTHNSLGATVSYCPKPLHVC